MNLTSEKWYLKLAVGAAVQSFPLGHLNLNSSF
jgi:hypothetical protein